MEMKNEKSVKNIKLRLIVVKILINMILYIIIRKGGNYEKSKKIYK